jgi:hypothetical protein
MKPNKKIISNFLSNTRQQTATGIFLNQVQWNNNQEAKLQVEFHEIPP